MIAVADQYARLTRFIDWAMALGVLLVFILWLLSGPKSGVQYLPLPEAFPEPSDPIEEESSRILPTVPQGNAVAESCLIAGMREVNRENMAAAEQWFQKAVAIDADHPKYRLALTRFRMLQEQALQWQKIESHLHAGRFPEAWEAFVLAGKSRQFFCRFALVMVEHLEERGQGASATVVLQTLIKVRPGDRVARKTFENLLVKSGYPFLQIRELVRK